MDEGRPSSGENSEEYLVEVHPNEDKGCLEVVGYTFKADKLRKEAGGGGIVYANSEGANLATDYMAALVSGNMKSLVGKCICFNLANDGVLRFGHVVEVPLSD